MLLQLNVFLISKWDSTKENCASQSVGILQKSYENDRCCTRFYEQWTGTL